MSSSCCEQLFGSRISSGTVDAILSRTADALTDPYDDLIERIRAAPALNMDETGWRTAGARRALWGAFTDRHAVLASSARPPRRSRQGAAGPQHSDRHLRSLVGVRASAARRRQACWSHLQRDFKAHADGLGAEKAFGEAGLQICEALFWAWEIFAHTNDRSDLKLAIRVLRRELKPILRTYSGKAPRYKYTRGMARNLLKIWSALWTFADHNGVEPTNNHAERALRGSVIYRKLSFGSQSERGERRIERLLSAHTTCRLQQRSLHAYLIDALSAHTRGDPVPLLA